MSERPKKSVRPEKKSETARSGEHPAVRAYREKLDSVTEGAAVAASEIDKQLQEFLAALRTPVPPKPEPETPSERKPGE